MKNIKKLTIAQKRALTKGLVETYLGVEDDLEDETEHGYYKAELKAMLKVVNEACKFVGL